MVQVAVAAVGMGMEEGEESRGFCKSLADKGLWWRRCSSCAGLEISESRHCVLMIQRGAE